jgi:hypothetical protein
MELSWDEIFNAIGPYLIDEMTESAMRNVLEQSAFKELVSDEAVSTQLSQVAVTTHRISSDDFQTIKVQLLALGLIRKSAKARPVKDSSAYWTLTPFGESTLNRLRAVRRVPLEKQA